MLDLYRAIAAGLVVLEHARHYLFVDYGEIESPNLVTKVFYFITQFGHEAVLLFFVLSGLVVGRIVVDQVSNETWSWRDYLFARLTRLWIVLIPAIILTGILDLTALQIASDSHFVHQGGFAHIQHHPLVDSLGVGAFVGNLVFLQTIFVPPFGSNGPLWSLAYEFWYYVLFAGVWVTAFSRAGLWSRVIGGLVGVLCLIIVNREILVLSGVWLLGVVAYLAWKRFPIRGIGAVVVLMGSLSATLACLVALRVAFFDSVGLPNWCGQYLLGAVFAVCVWASLEFRRKSLMMRLGEFFSRFSYSLYLVHLPVLSILIVPFISGNVDRMWPGMKSYGVYGAVVILLYLVSYLFFAATEKNTGKLRRWIKQRS
ncbi:MAG: acyltransferase [Verrucomicrobiota bacterium]